MRSTTEISKKLNDTPAVVDKNTLYKAPITYKLNEKIAIQEVLNDDNKSEQEKVLAKMATLKDASDSEHESEDQSSSSDDENLINDKAQSREKPKYEYKPSLPVKIFDKVVGTVHDGIEGIASMVSKVGYPVLDKIEEKTDMRLLN